MYLISLINHLGEITEMVLKNLRTLIIIYLTRKSAR
nr:MAG TPA: hypothetical protein [Caudoviricetes sp.]